MLIKLFKHYIYHREMSKNAARNKKKREKQREKKAAANDDGK